MRNFNKDYSLIRILHAVPGGEDVDIYLNGNPLFNELDFTKFTPYVYIPKGTYTIEVFEEDTKINPILQEKITVEAQELVTVAIIIDEGKIKLLPIKEDMEIAEGNKSKVRFVHLVSKGRTVNILMDNEKIFTDVSYKDVTEYKELDPKLYDVAVESVDSKQLIRRLRINVNPNRIYTFYAIGEAPNFEIIQSLDGATFMN